jgi:hypothetical protein
MKNRVIKLYNLHPVIRHECIMAHGTVAILDDVLVAEVSVTYHPRI